MIWLAHCNVFNNTMISTGLKNGAINNEVWLSVLVSECSENDSTLLHPLLSAPNRFHPMHHMA